MLMISTLLADIHNSTTIDFEILNDNDNGVSSYSLQLQ
jgi:hypothetical protein